MEIRERDSGGVTILDLSGRIVQGAGDLLLKEKLQNLVQAGRKDILLNLAGVSYIDSAGLGTLVSAHISLTREGARIKLANANRKVQSLLAVTRLHQTIEAFDSEAAALESFRAAVG